MKLLIYLNLVFFFFSFLLVAEVTKAEENHPQKKERLNGKLHAQNDSDVSDMGSSAIERNELLNLNDINPIPESELPKPKESNSQPTEIRAPDAVSSAIPVMVPNPNLLGAGIGLKSSTILPSGLIEKIYQAQYKSESPTVARKKMMDEAILKTSEAAVQEIIGPVRFQKSHTQINEKIIKLTGRFIPVVKTGDLIKDPEGNFNLLVTMDVNTKTLESLLKDNGLLYEVDSTPLILPLMSFEDHIQNREYRWWNNSKIKNMDFGQQGILNQYLNFEKQLQQNFMEQGFYVEKPQASGLNLLIPSSLNKTNLAPEDWLQMTTLFKASAIIDGTVSMNQVVNSNASGNNNGNSDVQIEVQIKARQVTTGRVLAELYRKSNWENTGVDIWSQRKVQQWVDGTLKDLSQQVKEAWQRGTFSSSVLRLVVKGGLPISRYQKFKEQIQTQSKAIRQIRERMIGADELIFEIDVNGSIKDVQAQLQSIIVDDMKFKLMASDNQSLTFIKN